MVEDEATKWYCDHPSCKRQRAPIKREGRATLHLLTFESSKHLNLQNISTACQKRLQSSWPSSRLKEGMWIKTHPFSSRQPGWEPLLLVPAFLPRCGINGLFANLLWLEVFIKCKYDAQNVRWPWKCLSFVYLSLAIPASSPTVSKSSQSDYSCSQDRFVSNQDAGLASSLPTYLPYPVSNPLLCHRYPTPPVSRS